MRSENDWAPGPGVRVVAVERDGDRRVISAVGPEIGLCPGCNEPSTRRHSRYVRHLQDLPVQGVAVRERIEAQLSRVDRSTGRALLPEANDEDVVATASGPGVRRDVAEHRHLSRQTHRRSRQAIFDLIHGLRNAGHPISAIARQTAFGSRTIREWLKFDVPPERRATAPKPCSPSYFFDYLSRRWAEGCVRGRELLHEIKLRGYTGSFSHLERLLTKWRRSGAAKVSAAPVTGPKTEPKPTMVTAPTVDPATGWTITPIVAASLCIKPRGLLTLHQAAKVDALKDASPEFTAMRRLAMRFRAYCEAETFRGSASGSRTRNNLESTQMQRFARTVRRDLAAVTNDLTEEWSNGQTEGHINRLKTLKRAMYGRAGVELQRARMLPLHLAIQHGK